MSLRRISILMATTGLVAVPGALAAGLPKVPKYSGHASKGQLTARPTSILYTADGSGFFAGAKASKHRDKPLTWTKWTARGGDGTGFNWVNNCTPNCAQGRFHSYPVKLHVWRARRVRGHLIFTRMTVTYTGGQPSHVHKSEVWKVTFNSGGWFWSFPPN